MRSWFTLPYCRLTLPLVMGIAGHALGQTTFTFNTLPANKVYSNATGFPVGSPLVTQDGVVLRSTVFRPSPPALSYGEARIFGPSTSGFSTNSLNLFNFGVRVETNALPRQVGLVRLEYRSLGGSVNVGVNGSPLYVGRILGTPPLLGGTSIIHQPPVSPSNIGTLEFRGFISDLTFAGSDIAIDNVAVQLAACECAADFDRSGGTPDVGDVAAFFNAWSAGLPTADVDCSGGTPDAADTTDFFEQWLAGGCTSRFVLQDFQSVPTQTWSRAGGFAPGQAVIDQQGLIVRLAELVNLSGSTTFDFGGVTNVANLPFADNHVTLDGMGLDFDFTGIGFEPSRVVIDVQASSRANLSVNGSPVNIGSLESLPPTLGGVRVTYFTSATSAVPRLVLSGPIRTVRLGDPSSMRLDNVLAD